MILALALTLATSSAPVTRVIPEHRYEAKLVRALDGDTISVLVTARATTRLPGRDLELSTSTVETVRLAGVNAPESKGKCEAERKLAQEAKLYVEGRLRGETFEVVTRGQESEKFGRTLADIEVGGLSLSQELIRRGLADPYHGEKRDPDRWCGGGGRR